MKIKKRNLFVLAIFIMIFFSFLNIISNPIFSLFGKILLIISLSLIFIYIILYYNDKKKIDRKIINVLKFLIILIFYYLILAFLNGINDLNFDFKTTLQLLLISSYILLIVKFKITDLVIKLFYFFGSLMIFILFVLLVYERFPKGFEGFFANPNTLGALMSLYLFFILIKFKTSNKKILNIVLMIMSFLLLYYSMNRSSMLLVIIALSIILLWPIIIKNKFIFNSSFFLIIILITSFVYFYSTTDTIILKYLNDISIKFIGKNIYSGRQQIWSQLISLIRRKLFFGYGPATQPGNLLNNNLSAHNLYLQIFIQSGVIGVSLFVLFLYDIWKNFWKNRTELLTKYSASFFIAILIQQIFSVFLIQNNLSIGIVQWTIIALGISVKQSEKMRSD
jgi:O-antigen ligase